MNLPTAGTKEQRVEAAMRMWDACCQLAEETRDLLTANDAFNAMLCRMDITLPDFHKALKDRAEGK